MEFPAVYIVPNKIADVGVAYFTRDGVLGELMKRVGYFKLSTAFPAMINDIPMIEGDKCIFLSSKINSDIEIQSLSKCLQLKKVDHLFFKRSDSIKIGHLLNAKDTEDEKEDDEEGYHSCCEGEPIQPVESTTMFAKTPAVSFGSGKSKSGKQTSGKYKTPKFESNPVQPKISVDEKLHPAHSALGPKNDDSEHEEEDHHEKSDSRFSESSPMQKRDNFRVSPPFTPPKNRQEESEDMEASQTLRKVWHSMKVQGFKTLFGFSHLAHLGSDNEIYVIPGGRGYDQGGIENVEFFITRIDFVRHLKRNFCLLEDFDSFWSRMEKVGWIKEWNSDGTKGEYIFPVNECGISVDLNGCQLDFSPKECLHRFPGRSSFHEHILRYPYPLQPETTLKETLETQGWIPNSNKSNFFFPDRSEFVFADGSRKKSLNIHQVRQLLWTNPTLLYADVRSSLSTKALEDLTIATHLPADRNVRHPNDDALDIAESNLNTLLTHISTLRELRWQSGGEKGVSFVVPDKDVPKLEKMIQAINWKIVDKVSKSNQWWSCERAYMPNWKYSDFGVTKKMSGLIPGIDIFWAIDDVLKYLSLYKNAPPLNIEQKSMTLRVDMTRENPVSRMLSASSEDGDNAEFFERLLPELMRVGWRVMDVPVFMTEGVKVERVLVPSWIESNDINLKTISSLTARNKDFFTCQESVLRYLRVFGNRKVSSADFKANMSEQDSDSNGYLHPIPKVDKDGAIIEDESYLQSKISYLVHVESKSRYITVDVMNILVRLGWRFDVKVPAKYFSSTYVTMPPWGFTKFENGEFERMQMKPNEDYFSNQDDMILYLTKYGVYEIDCQPAPLACARDTQSVGRLGRRSSIGNDLESQSKFSGSTMVTAASNKTKSALEKDKSKCSTARGNEHTAKTAKKRSLPSKSVVNSEEDDATEVASSQTEESVVDQEEEKEEEEVPYVDPYPALSDEGIEGEIKEVMIAADSVGAYKFAALNPYLLKLGWKFHIKSKNAINDYYILSPWGMEQYESQGNHISISMIRGKDFFVSNREVVEYIEKYGINEVPAEVFVGADDKSEGGRMSRRSSSMPPPAAPPSAKFAVPKGKITKRPAQVVKKPSAPAAAATNASQSKKSKKSKSSRSSKASASPASSQSEEETMGNEEDENDFTLSQIMSRMEEENTCLPEVDRECSREIKALLTLATTPPRLLLCEYHQVWNVLKTHGWSWDYCNSYILGADRIVMRPNRSINKKNWKEFTPFVDYFTSEEDVLAFIKTQVLARGWNYGQLVDRARFIPGAPRFQDDEEHLEGEEENAAEDEECAIITHKLPTRGLFQSGDSYQTIFDHYDGASDVSDADNDVPAYSLASIGMHEDDDLSFLEMDREADDVADVAGSNKRSEEEHDSDEEYTQPQENEELSNSPTTQSQSLSSQSSTPRLRSKRKSPSQDSLVSIHKKTRTTRLSNTSSNTDKENSPTVEKIESLGAVIDRVKNKLSPSYMPNSVVGRSSEFEELFDVVSTFLNERRGGSIRLAGQPGQGKTLTTSWLIKTLEKHDEMDGVARFSDVTWIVGASLHGGCKELCHSLDIAFEGTSEEHCKAALRNVLLKSTPGNSSRSSKSRSRSVVDDHAPMRIIVVDEIDMLPKNIFQSLMQLANHDNSNFILIGLANDAASSGYSHEIVFEVYQADQMISILKGLTDNLLDDSAAAMIVKTTSANGDIRPMTYLALRCVEKAEQNLIGNYTSEEDIADMLSQPSRTIVTLPIVNQCRVSSSISLTTRVKSVPPFAKNLLVALALQFEMGQTFSLAQAQDAMNTFGDNFLLSRVDMNTLCQLGQQLLENALLNNTIPGVRHTSRTTLSQIPQSKSVLSLSVSAEELVEQCASLLAEGPVRELQRTIHDRSLQASS